MAIHTQNEHVNGVENIASVTLQVLQGENVDPVNDNVAILAIKEGFNGTEAQFSLTIFVNETPEVVINHLNQFVNT